MKNKFIILGRIFLTYLSLIFAFVIGGVIAFPNGAVSENSASTNNTLEANSAGSESYILLISSFFIAMAFAYYLYYSKVRGAKLFLNIFLIYFGINTFLPQLETWYFSGAFNFLESSIGKIVLMGLITALLFSILATVIWRKKKESTLLVDTQQLAFKKWLKPTLLIAISYVVIYFLFGYFIAWQSPAVRQFYSGSTELLPFWEHFVGLITDNPLIYLFQFFRGIIWAALAFLIWQTVHLSVPKKMGLTGILFCISAALLLMPNPFMPADVRWSHFVETLSSNFIFGILAAWIIHQFTFNNNTISITNQL